MLSRTGQILERIDVLRSFENPSGTGARPKGLTLAPSSDPNDDPDIMSLWVADYGKDQVMDGRLFEIQLARNSNLPPLFTTNNDTVNFNQVDAGTYQPGSQYNALGGNDTVTLPANVTEAAAAGFNTSMTFSGGDGNDVVTGGTLGDRVSGGNGNDLMRGGAGNDSLNGDSNADTLSGGSGNDTLNGGSSNDALDYAAAAGAVTVNLALGTATGEGSDTLLNPNMSPAPASMTDHGQRRRQLLGGNGGNDTIRGGGANDTLAGGAGTDRVLGESGHDTLTWDSADTFDGGIGFDTLDANLTSANTIDLRTANFANLERIRAGGGSDVVSLSLNDVLSDTADNQFVADLGTGSADTLNIDRSGGWTATTPNATLGPTGVAAGISVAGLTARTFTNGDDTVTIFSNAEIVNT